MTGRLIHYSQKPSLRHPLANVAQVHPYGDMTGAKPRGLWVSPQGEDDWREWCLAEQFRLYNLRHLIEITLAPNAQVLTIATSQDMRAFNDTYRADISPAAIEAAAGAERVRALMPLMPLLGHRHFGIDWRNVARDYQGIIIAPYQYDFRLQREFFWYYVWDCASGCIWHADAVARITVLPERGATEAQIRRGHHRKMKYTRRKSKKLFSSASRNLWINRA